MKLQKISNLLITKYLRPWDPNFKFESLINIFSIFITLTCTALILIILSVNNGFKNNIVQILTDINGENRIYSNSSYLLNDGDYENILEYYNNKIEISRFHTSPCIVRNKNFSESVILHSSNRNDSFFRNISKYIYKGNLSDSTIIVGDLLLEKSNINIGDYLSIIEINLDSGVENIYNFKISGSFKTNIPDYDSHFIFCNTELLNNVNGYEYFHINNFENLNMEYLENNFFLTDVTDMNKSFFNWLQTYDNPIKILVCFILLISFMNIINNNYYLLYYKKKQINILLTLGIDKFILKYIIITRSVYFSLIGCSLGVLVAYSFLLAEKYFAFVSLPSYIYFIDSLPIEINYNYIIYIFLYIALIGLLSSLFSYRTNSRC